MFFLRLVPKNVLLWCQVISASACAVLINTIASTYSLFEKIVFTIPVFWVISAILVVVYLGVGKLFSKNNKK